jgi:CheY-like chemotaxis protein
VSRSRKTNVRGYRITRFIQVLAWPAVVIIIALVLFRDRMASEEVVLDARGVKISFYLQQAAEHGGPEGKPPQIPPDMTTIVRMAQRASSMSLSGAIVLWLDENPDNNWNEREALAQLGLQFVLVTSTSEAIQQMKNKRFNAAITSFKLGDDPEAGYTLLTAVKKIAPALPVVIYAGRVSWEHEAEAKRRGAFDETNSPVRLFDLIVSIIKGTK